MRAVWFPSCDESEVVLWCSRGRGALRISSFCSQVHRSRTHCFHCCLLGLAILNSFRDLKVLCWFQRHFWSLFLTSFKSLVLLLYLKKVCFEWFALFFNNSYNKNELTSTTTTAFESDWKLSENRGRVWWSSCHQIKSFLFPLLISQKFEALWKLAFSKSENLKAGRFQVHSLYWGRILSNLSLNASIQNMRSRNVTDACMFLLYLMYSINCIVALTSYKLQKLNLTRYLILDLRK